MICFIANGGWSAGPQAICFLEWQSERVQPASLNSSERKNHQHQLSSSQTGLLEYFLFTSPHYHTQALQIESLMPTGHLTHHRGDCWSCLIGRPGKALWKLHGWLTEAMEKRRSQVQGWIVLAPFLIMSFSIVDKRCTEIRVQGGRTCAMTVGFTPHVKGMNESVFSRGAEGYSRRLQP